MIDFDLIVGFEWDQENSRKSVEKHGVSQSEAEQIFFNDLLLVVEDGLHSQREARFHALGRTNEDRPLHVTFALRQEGTRIRIISARAMSRKERALYAKAK